MSVNRGFDFQMLIRIETHRDSGETPASEKLCEFLGGSRRWSLWIDVDHLPRAIDHHSELRHFVSAEETVEMRTGNQIDLILVGYLHRDVRESAVSHRQGGELTNSVALCLSSDAPDILLCLLHLKPELLRARPVEQSNRATAVDHQCRPPAIDNRRGEEMISEAPLQRRSAKTFVLHKRFQRGRRGSGGLTRQRWRANNCGNRHSEEAIVHGFFSFNS